jgi:LysM repeat protein
MVTNCIAFHRVSEGDTCAVVASNNDISLPTLVKYNGGNPAMCDPLPVGTTWCVDIYHDPVVVTTTTKVVSSTTKSAGVATPTPVQSGMVAGCTKFYLVQEGDNCLTIARANGISAANVTKWNPVADDNDTCTGLLPGYYACVAA